MYESFKSFLTSKAKLSILAAALIFGLGNNIKAARLKSWANLFQEYVNQQQQQQQPSTRFKEIKALSEALSEALSSAGQYDHLITSAEALKTVKMTDGSSATQVSDLETAKTILFFKDLNNELMFTTSLIATFREPFKEVLEMANGSESFQEAPYQGVHEVRTTLVSDEDSPENLQQKMHQLIEQIFTHYKRAISAASYVRGINSDLIGEGHVTRINEMIQKIEEVILSNLNQAAEAAEAEAAAAEAEAEAEAAEEEGVEERAAEKKAEERAAEEKAELMQKAIKKENIGREGIEQEYEQKSLVFAISNLILGKSNAVVLAALNEVRDQQQQLYSASREDEDHSRSEQSSATEPQTRSGRQALDRDEYSQQQRRQEARTTPSPSTLQPTSNVRGVTTRTPSGSSIAPSSDNMAAVKGLLQVIEKANGGVLKRKAIAAFDVSKYSLAQKLALKNEILNMQDSKTKSANGLPYTADFMNGGYTKLFEHLEKNP